MKAVITKELWICDHCKKTCDDPLKTLIIKGNITIANYNNNLAEIGAGLIGKHYEKPMDFDDVMESSFHDVCFIKAMMKMTDVTLDDIE